MVFVVIQIGPTSPAAGSCMTSTEVISHRCSSNGICFSLSSLWLSGISLFTLKRLAASALVIGDCLGLYPTYDVRGSGDCARRWMLEGMASNVSYGVIEPLRPALLARGGDTMCFRFSGLLDFIREVGREGGRKMY